MRRTEVAPESSELDEATIERLVRRRERAAGHRTAARRALRLARRYRAEEGVGGGERERACVAQAMEWRRTAAAIAAESVADSETKASANIPRPGLARTRLDRAEAGERENVPSRAANERPVKRGG